MFTVKNYSYIKLFIGISEVVMGGENVLQSISTSKYDTYPGIEDNDEEEEIAESLDIHAGKIEKIMIFFIYIYIFLNYFLFLKNLEFAVSVPIHQFN